MKLSDEEFASEQEDRQLSCHMEILSGRKNDDNSADLLNYKEPTLSNSKAV
jgi:hypothetical protein